MTVSAGAVAGSVVNAFAVNEASIVHVLTGELTIGFKSESIVHTLSGKLVSECIEKLNATQRISMKADGDFSDAHRLKIVRRTALQPNDNIALSGKANTSQRHGTKCSGDVALSGSHRMTQRRRAIVTGRLSLNGRTETHVRRSAIATDILKLSAQIVHARRRQNTSGMSVIHFMHGVNLRALSPIYGKSKIELKEVATAVRRVGLPSHNVLKLNGLVGATARRCFTSVSPIAFNENIKMPHVHMVPTEPYRELHVREEDRYLIIRNEERLIKVYKLEGRL